MRAGEPSRTAEYVALFRALEAGRRRPLFYDPFASSFLGLGLRTAAALGRIPLLGGLVPAYIDRRYPGPRPSAVARTRAIDDATTEALEAGATQLVILGAGYDTRPYRLPAAAGAAVFEVDHPDTQARKIGPIAGALGRLPANVRFVPVDFAVDDVGDSLAAAGLDQGAPTFFIWEGVLGYLEPDAIDAMLRWMASTGAPGSRVVFTYIDKSAVDGGLRDTPWVQAVGRAGEPFRTGLDPAELPEFLAERGLRLLGDETTVDAARRYGISDRRMPDFYRVALAESG